MWTILKVFIEFVTIFLMYYVLVIGLGMFSHLKRPWCWERLRAGGEGDNRGWGGWMAPPTQWTWVWVGSGSWCRTGRPGMLQLMGSKRVGHGWATELNWTQGMWNLSFPTRDQTCKPCTGRWSLFFFFFWRVQVLTTGPPGKFLCLSLFLPIFQELVQILTSGRF